MAQNNYDYTLKILVIGDYMVGKTSLIQRFTKGTFLGLNPATITLDFENKILKKDDKLIKVQTWDACRPNDRFRIIYNSIYRGTHGIVITYDITDKNSFIDLRKWFDEILRNAPFDTRIILIGNKYDLSKERKVTEEEGKKFADEFGMLFFETSAKTGYNVNFAFETLIEDIIKHFKHIEERKIKLKKDNRKKINKNENKCYE